MKKIVVLAVLVAAAVSGACWYWNQVKTSDAQADLRLYGNVDIRQVSLAFEVPGRIKAVHADEGQGVKRGDLLAELDTTTLRLQAAQARARLEQAEQGLKKLQNGSRPEEIEQAKSMLQAAKARERKASTDYDIAAKLWKNTATRAVSTQQYESARNALDAAKAEVTAAEQTYRLARIGPRAEDIGAAAGLRDEALANLRLLEHQIELGSLRSPQDGIVRTRLLEAGDMASSTRAVYTLALMTPKWVRVYVSEPSLGRVKPGMKAAVCLYGYRSRPGDRRIRRLHFLGCRIHAQERTDRGAAHKFGVRGESVGGGSLRCAQARAARHGCSRTHALKVRQIAALS